MTGGGLTCGGGCGIISMSSDRIRIRWKWPGTIRKRVTFCESEGGAGAAVGGGRHMMRQNGARRLPTVCKTFSFADSFMGPGISQGMPGIRFPVCVVRVFRA